ncbi:MAG: L-seryl-tRNA(Sec) selenium transferase [Pseudomonadota bacterium]
MTRPSPPALALLPGVDRLLARLEDFFAQTGAPRSVAVAAVRRAVEDLRAEVLASRAAPADKGQAEEMAASLARDHAKTLMAPRVRRLVNATGVVVHTNLGRSPLAPCVCRAVAEIAGSYSNLEFDLATGRRGSRYSLVADLLCELTGAEAALVVNNNAGAVLLALAALAAGREAVVSRGELVEIGGSFRIPEVMAQSGAVLREVGATNRTHPRDYENAVNENTALFLKVHASNFAVVGFTASVSLPDLVALGKKHGVAVMEDLGSGSLVDFSAYGLSREPTVQDSVAAGADEITYSGDKMLGGPQAGIILGRADMVERIRTHPLNRALRVDKMTLTALEHTLRLYRDPERALAEIPTLARITEPEKSVGARARRLAGMLNKIAGVSAEVVAVSGRVGGGALPLEKIPSRAVALTIPGLSENEVEAGMRGRDTPVIGRIEDGRFLMDLRTVFDEELALIAGAAKALARQAGDSPETAKS